MTYDNNLSDFENTVVNKIRYSKVLNTKQKRSLIKKAYSLFEDYYFLKRDYRAGICSNRNRDYLSFNDSATVISEYILDTIESPLSGFHDYREKINFSKITGICVSYDWMLSCFKNPRIDTYKKASILLTTIIENNVIEENEDKNIEFAFSVASRMCSQPFQYTGINNMIPKKLDKYDSFAHFYELDLGQRDYFKKCVKAWKKEWREKQLNGFSSQDTIEYACKFEEILKYLHEYCCLTKTEGYKNVLHGVSRYDEMFKDEEKKENPEPVLQKKKTFFDRFKK